MMKKVHIDGLEDNVFCYDKYLVLSDEARVAIYNATYSTSARYKHSRIKEYAHGCLTACFWNDRIALEFLDNYRDLHTYGNKELLYACTHDVADEGDFLVCVYGSIYGGDLEIYTYRIDEPVDALAYFTEDEESEEL
jgi:hypothetical protein